MESENNVIIDISEVPKKRREPEPFIMNTKKADTKLYLLLSFFAPCILVLICWIFQGVYPFGDNQILVTDFWHQYYPFANILHGKLQDHSSLLYTWESGMGSNFLAMMAYYAASPLNLFTMFVPEEFLREAITFILAMKIGFAGLFTGMFLKYTFRRNDISVCCFAVLYALCSYMMGYYWNIIWIDTVALLPLVMLGVVKLVREKKTALYGAAFALALISNYYIGLFICIFTVIAFFCICLFECKRFRDFLFSGLRMLGMTAVGLGISGFMLLPAYYALQLTNSADNTFPDSVSFYEEWVDLFANMTAFREPTVKEGLPNLYCGIICVVLAGMFIVSRHIRIREKISAVLILAFLLISCNMNVLNFIWHGFHFTNMLPYRYSFLFSFVLVVMAYRAFDLVLSGKIRLPDSIAMFIIAGGAFAAAWFSERNEQQTTAMWFSLAASLFYVTVMFLYERRVLKPIMMCGLISIGLFLEMFMNVRTGTTAVGVSDRVSYPSKSAEIQELLERIEREEDSLFYRAEISTWYTLNDPALYSYNGVSQFSSMANKNITTFLRKLGVAGSEAGNRYYYALTSPLTNMFTGIKYVISRTGDILDTETMEKLYTSGQVKAYKNEYALPIGFMVNEELSAYDGIAYDNPFEAQNDFFAKATGISEPLFTSIDVTHTSHSGMNEKNGVYKKSYGNYTYSVDKEAESHILQFNFIPEERSVLYAYFCADGVSEVNILRDNVDEGSYNVTKMQGFIAPIGTYASGEKASVNANITDDERTKGSIKLYVYALDTEVLEMAYERFLSESIELEEFSDISFTGTIDAKSDGLCYFSIPYDGGWTAYIDGEKAETVSIGGAMTGVNVSRGTHRIEFRYSPEGFTAGMIASSAGVLIWLTVLIMEYLRGKKKQEEMQDEKSESNDGISRN